MLAIEFIAIIIVSPIINAKKNVKKGCSPANL
jgi:hypothetical protein